ncbi:heptahelical transmembrane protein 4-like isoform X1 [Panicum miliaceum]|uniref:Heptahelical transmembrane protein 4-like isoform X1 n=1 Tax=Panicum miliaceum TaxID=4540 RepID=A0A3L6R7T7_PANMI|nr:heptahelical transmembrane protein 4-like isoform X1 [Panicum miliaceum]
MCARKARATAAPAKAATKRCWRSISRKSLEEEPMASSTATSCIAWNGAEDKKEEEKKSKCELIRYDALPDWLKDNEFIHGYYRCEWPMKETILSIFSIHNETLNVWSHLIGFLLFLCLTVFTAMVIPRDGSSSSSWSSRSSSAYWGDLVEMANMTVALRHEALAACFLLPPSAAAGPGLSEDGQQIPTSCPPNTSSSHHRHHGIQIQQDTTGTATDALAAAEPVTRWPLFAYLGGAMLCLLTSSACHLILCHSERTAYVTLRLDYAGIASLIVTSFYPLAYYSFLCAPALRRLYMGSITALGAAAATVSLVPAFQAPELRPLRAALFSCMGASGVVPIAHKLMLYGGTAPGAVASAAYEALMGALYGLGVAVYAARVPERWAPGRFDLVGHSHQLFHLFVVAGAYAHYLAGVEYLKWRDVDKC